MLVSGTVTSLKGLIAMNLISMSIPKKILITILLMAPTCITIASMMLRISGIH